MTTFQRNVLLCVAILVALPRTALALDVSGGDVPLPAKTVNGKLQVSWDGSYADLLAADALAMCWTTQTERAATGGTGDWDPYLAYLASKMVNASCRTTCAAPPAGATTGDIQFCAWMDGRKDATCNMDAALGTPRALDTSKMRSTAETSAYQFPPISGGSAPLAMSGTFAQNVRDRARDEVAYAELNLCIAEHLRQKLDTVQVAFASGGDLEQIQERVRERSLTATWEYTMIMKALASPGAIPTVINDPDYWLAPITLWGRLGFTQLFQWSRIGDDYAAAISLLAEATENVIELKTRQPAAQRSFGTVDSGRYNNGVIGPRVDIQNLLFDGMVYSPRRAVWTDMSAPEVGSLLGLARRANALRITMSSGAVDRNANGRAILLTTENFIRNEESVRQGVPIPPATSTTLATDYTLWKRYGITSSHAQTIVDALTGAFFGPPNGSSLEAQNWFYSLNPFAADQNGPFGMAQQMAFHILGQHNFTGPKVTTPASPPTGDLVVDPAFRTSPLRSNDFQSMRPPAYLPVRDIIPGGSASTQVWSLFRSTSSGTPYYQRSIGSASVLGFAREALLQLGALAPSARPYAVYQRVNKSLQLIEQMIGPRQVTIRQQLLSTPNDAACSGCVLLRANYTPSGSTTNTSFTIDILTKSSDPYRHLAISGGFPHAATAVQDPNYMSIWGTGSTQVAGAPYTSLFVIPLTDSYELRRYSSGSFSDNTSLAHGLTILLRTGTGTASDNYKYEHVFTGHPALVSQSNYPSGVNISFGGRFARLVEDAWKFETENWSSPRFDAFGLPRDWAPAADASIQGEQGVPVERHLLDRAATAATAATSALQQAFDSLQQEAIDDSALAAADTRAQQLNSLEFESLCGAKMTCTPTYTRVLFTVPQCTGPVSTYCETERNNLKRLTGMPDTLTAASGVPLALPVSNATFYPKIVPTFDEYKGGRLQGLFVNQFSAYQSVYGAIGSAIAVTLAGNAQVDAAQAEATAAQAEYAQVQTDIDTAYAQLIGQVVGLAGQQQTYKANRDTYQAQLDAAKKEANDQCNESAFWAARESGYSWSGAGDDLWVEGGADQNGWSFNIHSVKTMTWSAAPTIAQLDRCHKAQDAYDLATKTLPAQRNAMQTMVTALQLQIKAANLQIDALPKRLAAAQARKEAADARVPAAIGQRDVQVVAANSAVQNAYNQLLGTVAAIDEAYLQANIATSRINLENSQTGYDIRTRFGLRKRFHSYDLWRARALTENARRLAVAARRAIETRYVVDLSTLKASEPFVAAPALWADDIYAPDLKPPVALGLTRSPTTASGIYTNKLDDYVNNLKLFLDGYVIERPSAAVKSDAEVIQLAGPAAQVVGSSFEADFTYIDTHSAGWSFYCPASNSWISHPNLATFSATTPAWALSTACGGKPPTLARLGFSLDPWGRLQGHTADPPYSARYNVRSGNIALNLVGSGIRDCQKAVDKAACYAEPFIRYDLEHLGPAWVSNYDQAWRTLDIPRAFIEGGKALSTEEWLDPVSNGFNRTDVNNVSRMELEGRPIGGEYELTLELTPDVRVERIERIQILLQTAYWVRQK